MRTSKVCAVCLRFPITSLVRIYRVNGDRWMRAHNTVSEWMDYHFCAPHPRLSRRGPVRAPVVREIQRARQLDWRRKCNGGRNLGVVVLEPPCPCQAVRHRGAVRVSPVSARLGRHSDDVKRRTREYSSAENLDQDVEVWGI